MAPSFYVSTDMIQVGYTPEKEIIYNGENKGILLKNIKPTCIIMGRKIDEESLKTIMQIYSLNKYMYLNYRNKKTVDVSCSGQRP